MISCAVWFVAGGLMYLFVRRLDVASKQMSKIGKTISAMDIRLDWRSAWADYDAVSVDRRFWAVILYRDPMKLYSELLRQLLAGHPEVYGPSPVWEAFARETGFEIKAKPRLN